MKSKDIGTVETVLDLCRHATGYHILIMFLLVSGYTQSEIAKMLEISKQALNDELILILEQYRTGRPLTYRESKIRRRERLAKQ